jgi:hypothetical protein
MPIQTDPSRDLLFGLLALQNGLILTQVGGSRRLPKLEKSLSEERDKRGSLLTWNFAPHPRRPSPLRYCRRRPIVEVGPAVVGQALEIGPDQGLLRRCSHHPALAMIELAGQ